MEPRGTIGGAAGPDSGPLIRVQDLRTHFFTGEGVVRAVDGVSFAIEAGETLGLVGESGSGKSMTALSILRLVPPPGRVVGGRVLFEGKDLLALPEKEMRRVRGNRIAMVFQEPMTSLNPVFTIGSQIAEAVLVHRRVSRREARDRSVELLRKVKIPDAAERSGEYPHRLSGGMRQRVMIAMALACGPALLIADEPTTALDVTIQAQILELLGELQRELGMAILLITHNLGLVARFAGRIAVLYAGRVVESAPAGELFSHPLHPYTRALMDSVPRLGAARGERLRAIPGAPPDPLDFPGGCRFHPRCPERRAECGDEEPLFIEARPGHFLRCPVSGGPAPP